MRFELPQLLSLIPVAGATLYLLHMIRPRISRTDHFFPAFLAPSDPPSLRPSKQISDLTVLILRLLALLAIILAAAQPVRVQLIEGDTVQTVIVDASFSMRQQTTSGISAFQQAQKVAAQHNRRGARVWYCGARLHEWLDNPVEGTADFGACIEEIDRQGSIGGVLWLTDGKGKESPLPVAHSVQLIETIVRKAPSDPTVSLGQTNAGGFVLDNKLPWELGVGSAGALCPAQRICNVGEPSHEGIRVQVGSGSFSDSPVQWMLPAAGHRLTVTIVAPKVERGSYAGGRLLREALLALAAKDALDVRFATRPAALIDREGILIYLWNSLEEEIWQKALIRRSKNSVLWVVPGRDLADTLVPVPLEFAFGTYRGWLNRTETALPDDLIAGSAVTVPVQISRRISLAETDQAVVVWRDGNEQPLLVWSDQARPALIWTTGVDPDLSDLALTPWFVPLLSVLANRFAPHSGAGKSCIAGTMLTQGGRCPMTAGRIATGTSELFVLPDWHEFFGSSWATKNRIKSGSKEQTEPISALLLFAALLFLILSLIPFSRFARVGIKGKGLMLLLILYMVPSVSQAGPQSLRVGLIPGISVDPGRLEAFKRGSRQLSRRANIKLENPVVWYPDRQTDRVPALIWSNLCGSSLEAVSRAVQQGLTLAAQGIPWWVEDCGDPGESTPGLQSLRSDAARSLMAHRWEPVPSSHVVFKSYYLLSRLDGRFAPGGEKVLIDNGMPLVLFTPQDLTGKISYGSGGEQSYRSFVNIVFYMLMGNYKEDGIHVPYLLQRLKRSRK